MTILVGDNDLVFNLDWLLTRIVFLGGGLAVVAGRTVCVQGGV